MTAGIGNTGFQASSVSYPALAAPPPPAQNGMPLSTGDKIVLSAAVLGLVGIGTGLVVQKVISDREAAQMRLAAANTSEPEPNVRRGPSGSGPLEPRSTNVKGKPMKAKGNGKATRAKGTTQRTAGGRLRDDSDTESLFNHAVEDFKDLIDEADRDLHEAHHHHHAATPVHDPNFYDAQTFDVPNDHAVNDSYDVESSHDNYDSFSDFD